MRDEAVHALVGRSVDLQAHAIKRMGETIEAALSISTTGAIELKALYQALVGIPLFGRWLRARFAARRAELMALSRAARDGAS